MQELRYQALISGKLSLKNIQIFDDICLCFFMFPKFLGQKLISDKNTMG